MNVKGLRNIACLVVLVPTMVVAGESVDERWDIDTKAMISIDNTAGEVTVRGWDKNEVHLTGELGDSVDQMEVDASHSALSITVVNRNKRNVDETELHLMVPEKANIDVSVVSANIEVSGLENDRLTISSVSGDVEVEVTSQRVAVESVSGDIEFSGHTPRMSAETVSGDIRLAGVSGEMTATTVSGDMEIQAARVDGAKLETVSGDITASGELSGNARLSAESMSGDVVIVLPETQPGFFRAQSFSGRIYTDFGSVEETKHGPGSHLKYRSGNGGPEVRVESFSGNIKLKHD